MVVGEFTRETNLLVIGGGPAGYTAAFRAAELAIDTVLVDPRASLGGVCLHEGCIPSKTILFAAETVRGARRAADFGVQFQAPAIDPARLREWVAATVERLAKGLGATAKHRGLEIVRGQARFEDAKSVAVPGATVPRIKFKNALIATGSTAIEHPAMPFDGRCVLRPTEAVLVPRLPQKLLVVGAEYMALEIASAFAALGSSVTIVTAADQLLPGADRDLVRPLERQLAELVEAVAVGTDVASATVENARVRVTFSPPGPRTSEFDMVVVAMGQRACIDDLGLRKAAVECTADGSIVVDDSLRTSNRRIFAAGDVTGPPRLADRAMHQGRTVAEVVAGWGSRYEPRAVPMVAFTDPQVAWCGLTEGEAQARGLPHAVQKVPWGASGRAVGMGRAEGVTKIVYDPDVKLVLGVGMCGPHAAEMIAEGCLAIEMGAELADLAETIHPHPTMSELLSDAARAPLDRE